MPIYMIFASEAKRLTDISLTIMPINTYKRNIARYELFYT